MIVTDDYTIILERTDILAVILKRKIALLNDSSNYQQKQKIN